MLQQPVFYSPSLNVPITTERQQEASELYSQACAACNKREFAQAQPYLLRLQQIDPRSVAGQMLLGVVYSETGSYHEAITLLTPLASTIDRPDLIHHLIGRCRAGLHQYDAAYTAYLQALEQSPDDPAVLCSLGLLCIAIGQFGPAREYLEHAQTVQPDEPGILNNLGRLYKRIGRADLALDWFRCGAERYPQHPDLVSNYLYCLNFVAGLVPAAISEEYCSRAPRCFYPKQDRQPARAARTPREPLRIGYLSGDLYSHSVAFFLEPILQHHDRSRFSIFCYATQEQQDTTTERLRQLCDGWREIRADSDLQAAQRIAGDRIDILVELSGHTAGHRLGVCAYRPALIQVSWLGHPATTGLPQIDYYLTDRQCDPPGTTEQLYREQLYRLPRVFSCYLPPEQFPAVTPPPLLSTGRLTLGCFNNIAKINRPLISWWSAMLRQLDDAVLFVKGPGLWDKTVQTELTEQFRQEGIAEQRLLLRGETAQREDHLAHYAQIDIALDCFPYHGTTTTCEALWMGVPVVTLAGDSHLSRVGVSFLSAVGLEELIAGNPQQYIDTVVRLGRNLPRLRQLRHDLRMMMATCPLMDAVGVTRELEAGYRWMQQQTATSGSMPDAAQGEP
jgi:tetratricopeptide (TPR) repeat protein